MALLHIQPEVEDELRRAHYGTAQHGAVEVCRWTKHSLKMEGDCYKRKFYGIDTWACMEFTPLSVWCENNCIFCWRPMERFRMARLNANEVLKPQELVERLLAERRRLLSGFFGNPRVDRTKVTEALTPTHYAISLSGEPTLYPLLPELIRYLKALPRTRSVFLVTNGQEPEMLWRLQREKALPTQVYLSTNASNPDLFVKINLPEYADCWERYLESLRFLREAETRTVLRLTVIRGVNFAEDHLPDYAELIAEGNPHFVEVKAYMHVGRSTERLKFTNMPTYGDILNLSEKITQLTGGFEIVDSSIPSRVVLLQNIQRRVDRAITADA